MDNPLHQSLYAQGYEMRKKVVGEDYVAKALEKGRSDFMRPLQQFATVFTSLYARVSPDILPPNFKFWINEEERARLTKFRRALGERFGLVRDCH